MPLRERAYQILQRRIVTRELPGGAVLTEQRIAQDLGMSRTPVREALTRLHNEGLLTYVPQRGFSVKEMSVRDFVEIASLSRALQQFAVSELIHHDVEYDLSEIKSLHRKQRELVDDPWHSFELNIEMHTKIVGLLGNRLLSETARNIAGQIMLAGYVSSSSNFKSALSQVLDEHAAIISALEQRDLPEFIEALRNHDENGFRRMSGYGALKIG